MKFQFLLFLFSLVLMGGCTSQSSNGDMASGDRWLIVPGKSFGKINKENSTIEGIKALFGKDVREDSVYVGEGFSLPGLIVFPGQKNEVQIGYEPDQGDKPTFIRIQQEGTDWKTIGGITIGSTLEEVEKVNGVGFSFMGFGWDYGGTVTEWYDGKLEGLMMTLAPATENLDKRYFGDIEFGTLGESLPKKEIKVSSIAMRFLNND